MEVEMLGLFRPESFRIFQALLVQPLVFGRRDMASRRDALGRRVRLLDVRLIVSGPAF